MKLPVPALGLLALILSPALAPAAVVFSYDGFNNNYTDTSAVALIDSAGTAYAQGSSATSNRPFSTTPMISSTNYTGPIFFGGFGSDNAGSGLQFARLQNNQAVSNVTGDLLRFSEASGTLDYEVVFMGATTPAVFDGTSSVTMRVNRNVGEMRLILRSGGNYFISNQAVAMNNDNLMPQQSFNLAALTYSSYNPTADLDYVSSPSTYNPTITAFDAVGLYISRSGSNQITYIGAFTVNATPVPEPGAGMLGLLGAAFLAPTLRRRKGAR
jgi:hypothetical protein